MKNTLHLQAFMSVLNMPFLTLDERRLQILEEENFQLILEMTDGTTSVRNAVEQLVSGRLLREEYIQQVKYLNSFLLGLSDKLIVFSSQEKIEVLPSAIQYDVVLRTEEALNNIPDIGASKVKGILLFIQTGCLVVAMTGMIPQLFSIIESGFRNPKLNCVTSIFLLITIYLRNFIGYNKGKRRDVTNLRLDIFFVSVLSFTFVLFHRFQEHEYLYGILFVLIGLTILFLLRKYKLSWCMGSQT
jgi:hypothetical protein